MPCTDEIAHFRPDDAGCLVAASLSCPLCLSSDVDFALRPEDLDDPVAGCRCRGCGHRREVYLTPEQAVRLSLHEACPLDLSIPSSLLAPPL